MGEPLSFDVRVEIPQTHTATYRPASEETVRFSGVWQAEITYPANWGSLPGTLTSAGEPLGVWLLSSVPIAPQTLVKARAIGALTWHQASESRSVILAVPEADPAMAHLHGWDDLPADQRAALLLGVPDPQGAQCQGAFDAVQIIRAARRMARLARVGQSTGPATPVWQPTAGAFRVSEGMPHTLAELSLQRLPLRYQEYVAQMLAPDERILFFVPRPALHTPHRGLLDRQTRHNQGILVVTDQQVLWMVDALPPMEIVKGYGYIAKSCVLAHIVMARLVEEGDIVRFELALRSPAGGQEQVSIPFPKASRGLLRQVLAYLDPFLPGRRDSSLLRLSHLPATETALEDLIEHGDEATRALLPGWTARLQALLEDEETVVAQAVVPVWAEGPPRLLTVTDQRVLLLSDDQADGTQTLPLSHITSAELSHSVMQSWMRLWVAHAEGLTPVRLEFPLVTLNAFTRAYVAIRQALTAPAAFQNAPLASGQP